MPSCSQRRLFCSFVSSRSNKASSLILSKLVSYAFAQRTSSSDIFRFSKVLNMSSALLMFLSFQERLSQFAILAGSFSRTLSVHNFPSVFSLACLSYMLLSLIRSLLTSPLNFRYFASVWHCRDLKVIIIL